MPDKKAKANASSGNSTKPGNERVTYYVEQLAMALGLAIPTERILLYVGALSDLTEKQLAFGFGKALRHFKPEYGRTFPSPAEIREWAYEWRPVIDESKAILDRGDKPPDWEALSPEEIEAMRKRAGIIEHQVQAIVPDHAMPESLTSDEWERRKQQQLEAFRRKNKLGGEA